MAGRGSEQSARGNAVREKPTRGHFERAADIIRTQFSGQPRIAIILGSGLHVLAEQVEDAVFIPYDKIPNFPVTTVAGHEGRLIFGTLEGHEVLLMQGRAHYYEGWSLQQVTFPIRVMQSLGVETLIATNAAGALNATFNVGDLMLITDHIGLLNLAGLNPLRGANDDTLGPRFPDMAHAYDRELQALARQAAAENDIPLHAGVYASVAGPSFETPAELRFLRLIGADAVGMSTVPEVTVARHAGMRVLGISGLSNMAIFDTMEDREASHQEVLEAGEKAGPRLITLLRAVLRRLPRSL